ncbi:Protein CBG26276 [Caenorhabditis briggsae]|uniref:Protein CBG26276 n=1 Tax=Caenorhabditis briggsae TaxID=6238 RepID=B6IJI1_CAEBR|nr:Protein CBG26276 [Caenorhabditis briggsae]CAS00061.1 Protein CBG26276 [Caenorhabditis briggsae]
MKSMIVAETRRSTRKKEMLNSSIRSQPSSYSKSIHH